MEISLKYVVTAAVVVAVLTILSFFIASSSGKEISRSDASLVFSTMCQDFSAGGCAWPGDGDANANKFKEACKQLFGQDKELPACLYAYCDSCKKIEAGDNRCFALCSSATASPDAANRGSFCSRFTSGGCTITCGTCSGS